MEARKPSREAVDRQDYRHQAQERQTPPSAAPLARGPGCIRLLSVAAILNPSRAGSGADHNLVEHVDCKGY